MTPTFTTEISPQDCYGFRQIGVEPFWVDMEDSWPHWHVTCTQEQWDAVMKDDLDWSQDSDLFDSPLW